MANIIETPTFDAGVYRIETTDPVQGGESGVSNASAKNLANRTSWLKQQVDAILTSLGGTVAPLNSPALTGTPTAPTPSSGDNTTKIATTAFIRNAIGGVSSVSVAGSSNVVLTATQTGAGVIVLSGELTGNINVIFPVNGRWSVINASTGAFTITCKTAAGTGVVITSGYGALIVGDGTNIRSSANDIMGQFPAQISGNGWVKMPNGIILQWGTIYVSGDANTSGSFPTSFPNAVFAAYATYNDLGWNTTADGSVAIQPTTSGFTIRNGYFVAGTASYLAIGY